MEFTLQAFVVTGVNSAWSSPPLRGIFPPRGKLPSREASSPANILAGTRFSAAGKGNPAPQVVYGVDVWDIIIRRGKFRPTTLHKNPSQAIIPTTKNPECSPVRTTHSQNKSYPPILMKRSTPWNMMHKLPQNRQTVSPKYAKS